MDQKLTAAMLEFDFNDEIHWIDNPHSEVHPDQRNTVLPIFSNEKNTAQNGAGASSSEINVHAAASNSSKQKLVAVAAAEHRSNEVVDHSNENAPSNENVTPQANNPNPEQERSEWQVQAGDNNRVINIGSNPENNDSANCDQGSNSNLRLLALAAELMPPAVSPFDTPVYGYTTMNNERLENSNDVFRSSNLLELGSWSGSNNQALLFNGNSTRHGAQPNLMPSTNSGFWGNSDPSLLINPTNVQQNRSNFLNRPLPEAPRQSPLAAAGMVPQFGRVPVSNSENEFSPSHSNRQDHLLHLGMNPHDLSTAMGADHQLAQTLRNTESIYNQQEQALPIFPPSSQQLLSSSSTGLEKANQQQRPSWLFNNQENNPTFAAPSSPPRFPVAKPGETLSPTTKARIYIANYERDQALQLQLQLAANYNKNNINVQDAQGGGGVGTSTTLLQPTANPALHCYNYNQQGGGVGGAAMAAPADLLSVPSSGTLQLKNSLLSRADEQGGSLSLGHMMATDQQQPLTRPLPTYPSTPGTSLQLSTMNQVIDPATHHLATTEIFGGPGSSAAPLEHSLNPQNQQQRLGLGLGGGGRSKRRGTSVYDTGESSASSSSSSSKRSRQSHLLQEPPGPVSQQPPQSELDALLAANPFNLPRPVQNYVYDPVYETLGLPIDPHLRLFFANN